MLIIPIKRFLSNHMTMVQIILAGALPIVDLFCPEIKVIRGVLIQRSFFVVVWIPIRPL